MMFENDLKVEFKFYLTLQLVKKGSIGLTLQLVKESSRNISDCYQKIFLKTVLSIQILSRINCRSYNVEDCIDTDTRSFIKFFK